MGCSGEDWQAKLCDGEVRLGYIRPSGHPFTGFRRCGKVGQCEVWWAEGLSGVVRFPFLSVFFDVVWVWFAPVMCGQLWFAVVRRGQGVTVRSRPRATGAVHGGGGVTAVRIWHGSASYGTVRRAERRFGEVRLGHQDDFLPFGILWHAMVSQGMAG